MLPPLIFLIESGPIIVEPPDPLPIPDASLMRTALSRDFTVARGDIRLASPSEVNVNDIRISADFELEGDDLATDEGLETAVTLSLFTNRRAEDSDEIPDGQGDRQGWFGDDFADVPGDRFGSRLWLLSREKDLALVLVRAEEYARESLDWMFEDQVAERIDVTAEVTRPGWLGIRVDVYRPGGAGFDAYSWDAQGARGV